MGKAMNEACARTLTNAEAVMRRSEKLGEGALLAQESGNHQLQAPLLLIASEIASLNATIMTQAALLELAKAQDDAE